MSQLDQMSQATTLTPAWPISVVTYAPEPMQAMTLIVNPWLITMQGTLICTPEQTPALLIPPKPLDFASAWSTTRERVQEQWNSKYDQLSPEQSYSPAKQVKLHIAPHTSHNHGPSSSSNTTMTRMQNLSTQSLTMPPLMMR